MFGPARYLVGWQPFQSLEQLGPTAVFAALQLWQLSEVMADRRRLDSTETLKLRLRLFGYAAAAAAVAVGVVLPEGFIGPMSARVRSLFIKHTKTGNPLVDSVAEHQATPPQTYTGAISAVSRLYPGCTSARRRRPCSTGTTSTSPSL